MLLETKYAFITKNRQYKLQMNTLKIHVLHKPNQRLKSTVNNTIKKEKK